MTIEGRKEQKQVFILHSAKIHRAVRYFAMKIGPKLYYKRKKMK